MQIQKIGNITPDIKTHNIEPKKIIKQDMQNDSLEIKTDRIKTEGTDNNTKVSLKEGLSLIGKGFINKAKDLGKAIIKHPVKTIAIMAGTALGIAALPIIGISSAAGAAAIAIGCGAIAVGKTIYHSTKAIKHNKNGEYNELRNDLQKIGGDGLDLALSLPFVPKAFKTLQRNIKFAPTIGLNKELLSNIKNAKGLNAKYTELLKGDIKINYETMANEMGLKIKPQLVFDDTMQFDLQKGVIAGEYEPTTGVMKINPKTLNPIARIITRTNPEEILRHELTHFQQFSDIARTEGIGINGLKELLTEYYKKAIDIGGLPKQNFEYARNMVHGDKSVFNSKFYENIIREKGSITAGSQDALNVKNYMDGLIGKVTSDVDKIKALKIGILGPSYKDMKKVFKIYKENPLETPAYQAQEIYSKEFLRFRPNTTKDILSIESLALDEK